MPDPTLGAGNTPESKTSCRSSHCSQGDRQRSECVTEWQHPEERKSERRRQRTQRCYRWQGLPGNTQGSRKGASPMPSMGTNPASRGNGKTADALREQQRGQGLHTRRNLLVGVMGHVESLSRMGVTRIKFQRLILAAAWRTHLGEQERQQRPPRVLPPPGSTSQDPGVGLPRGSYPSVHFTQAGMRADTSGLLACKSDF